MNSKKVVLLLVLSLMAILFVLANLSLLLDSRSSGKTSFSLANPLVKNEQLSKNSLVMSSFAVLGGGESTKEVQDKSVQPKDIVNGACKPASKETNEGPGGDYCDREDYEECFDYFTKSTVYACNNVLWCNANDYTRYFDVGTDYCTNSYTLNEAFLNCGIATIIVDYLDWKLKNCNDYDGKSNWVYYCTDTEVMKRKWFSDYGCSDGACKQINGYWTDATLISKKGDIGYCNDRKEGVDNGWSGCSLCLQGDYDCDWSSDCSGNLVCKGSAAITYCPLAECGCCSSSKRWDSTLKTCCECSSGDCCDGCNYRSSSYVCDYHYGNYYYSCKDGNCINDDVYKRDGKRYCSGSSSSCSGNTAWNEPVIQEHCYSSLNEFCDGSTTWVSTSPICATAQCTSGECCDATCGEYDFQPTSVKCSTSFEISCSGNNLGDDVISRGKYQFCSGSSQNCNGGIGYGNWFTLYDCNSNEYCISGGCVTVICSKNSDCGTDGYVGYSFCKDGNVWKTYRSYKCNNPGTAQSSCSTTDRDDLIESCSYGCLNGACKSAPANCSSNSDCGTNGYTGSSYCNNGNIWQNYTTYTCNNPGTSSSSCSHTESGSQKQTCQYGCENGACKSSSAVNCSSNLDCGADADGWTGNPTCFSGDVWQTYTQHLCKNSGTASSYCDVWEVNQPRIECEYGCENNECKGQDLNPKPDLTVTELVVQSIRDKTVTLAFTIKNIGTATANNVYWKVDTNSADVDPKRTVSITLSPEEKTRAYLMWEYANYGIYNPFVIVDFNNLINESNENNNQMSISVTV